MAYEYRCKMILVGDASTGKSSIMQAYIENTFNTDYHTTIGVEYAGKMIEIDKKKISLNIWDTSGQERFRAITAAYYRGADGIVFVYDVGDRESFNNIKDVWKKSIDKYSVDNYKAILIGNKVDTGRKRVVSTEEGKELAETLGVPFIEVSAKTRNNINSIFDKLISMIEEFKKVENNKIKPQVNKPFYKRFCTIL